MFLNTQLIPNWPKLLWVAKFAEGSSEIFIFHGPMVEVTQDWIAEAVWAGDFVAGDFDQTDLVFGTGVRCRGGQVTFVSAGTAMDRLWYCKHEGLFYISNSFGGLSACAKITLLENHNYVNDRQSDFRTTWGLERCIREIPASPINVNLLWFNNLVYNGTELLEIKKIDSSPQFNTFLLYQEFLFKTAASLKNNLNAPSRSHNVDPFSTVSSGYDSPAAAVVAKYAGCKKAVTIERSSSFWRGSDSGKQIAEKLGMACAISKRTDSFYPHETAFWAASGWENLLNWTLFPYPRDVSIMFQGNYGDAVWGRKPLHNPFTIEIWDDLAMGEFRLLVGMIQCPVPFWGMRHAHEINRITFSEEMRPWSLDTTYDRPIPRRIIEEAGVPRGAFAVRKKDTSHETAFRWPYSPENQASFKQYLRNRSLCAPGPLGVKLLRQLANMESLIYKNITNKLDIRKRIRPWLRLGGLSLLFHWANQELKQFYQQGLDDCVENQGKK